jgi:hypothetical protein
MAEIQPILRIQPLDKQRKFENILIAVIYRNRQLRTVMTDGAGCAPDCLTFKALHIHFDEAGRLSLQN